MISIRSFLDGKGLIRKPLALSVARKASILIIMAYPIGDGQDSPGKPPEDSCAVAAIILAERLLKIGFICIIIRLIIEKAVAVSGSAEQTIEEGQTRVKLGAYSSVVFKLK